MAYDEALAGRLRDTLRELQAPGLTEKKMFGGLGFMSESVMVAAAGSGGEMMLRVDPAVGQALIGTDGIQPQVMRGREMTGWLSVPASAIATDEQLRALLRHGLDFARDNPKK